MNALKTVLFKTNKCSSWFAQRNLDGGEVRFKVLMEGRAKECELAKVELEQAMEKKKFSFMKSTPSAFRIENQVSVGINNILNIDHKGTNSFSHKS